MLSLHLAADERGAGGRYLGRGVVLALLSKEQGMLLPLGVCWFASPLRRHARYRRMSIRKSSGWV
jgi:hypothetical protein